MVGLYEGGNERAGSLSKAGDGAVRFGAASSPSLTPQERSQSSFDLGLKRVDLGRYNPNGSIMPCIGRRLNELKRDHKSCVEVGIFLYPQRGVLRARRTTDLTAGVPLGGLSTSTLQPGSRFS
ncbi:hypothetical protein ANN_03369 [Periplaneta americana]|uniref:Uncharacterized protein n=1 Tax=Periplaneta americana TaxID=6978 RepID=A0ABQ8U1Q3_PERAM|nr:hypothetical protein ANN_03369 [Periplaneta americana]